MMISPITSLTFNSTKNFNNNNKSINSTNTEHSDKRVLLNDIPYSYPVVFNGKPHKKLKKKNNEKQEPPYDVSNAVIAPNPLPIPIGSVIKAMNTFKNKYGINAELDPKSKLLKIDNFDIEKYDKNPSFDSAETKELLKTVVEVKGELKYGDEDNIEFPNLVKAKKISCHGAYEYKFPNLVSVEELNISRAWKIEFPELTSVKKLDCWGADNIKFVKLKTTEELNCGLTLNMQFPELERVEKIDLRGAWGYDFPKLTCVTELNCESATELKFPELVKAEKINLKKARYCDFPKLTGVTELDCESAVELKFPELVKVEQINLKGARNCDFPKLKDINI